MELLEIQRDLWWLPAPSEVRVVRTGVLPRIDLVTSVFVFAFEGERLLMTNLHDRGWDLPGGHIEPGEAPLEALEREVLEETGCALADTRLLGYQHVVVLGSVPSDYRYPVPESYQLLYIADVEAVLEFAGTAEARERGFFNPQDAEELPWVQNNRRLYQAWS